MEKHIIKPITEISSLPARTNDQIDGAFDFLGLVEYNKTLLLEKFRDKCIEYNKTAKVKEKRFYSQEKIIYLSIYYTALYSCLSSRYAREIATTYFLEVTDLRSKEYKNETIRN